MRTNMNRAGERGREGCVERNAMNLDSPPEGVKMEKMGERTKKMKKLKRDDTTAKSIAISASKNCFTAAMIQKTSEVGETNAAR
jgi:hypothetical protein